MELSPFAMSATILLRALARYHAADQPQGNKILARDSGDPATQGTSASLVAHFMTGAFALPFMRPPSLQFFFRHAPAGLPRTGLTLDRGQNRRLTSVVCLPYGNREEVGLFLVGLQGGLIARDCRTPTIHREWNRNGATGRQQPTALRPVTLLVPVPRSDVTTAPPR